jgi:battenin
MMAAGMILMAVASLATASWGFGLALFATILTGVSLTLGEGTIIGFLKFYPPKFVNAYSSGTGLAGIAGTGLILGLRAATLKDFEIFLIMLPFFPVYLLSFAYLVRQYKRHDGSGAHHEITDSPNEPMLDNAQATEENTEQQTGNATFSKEQIKFVLNRCWFLYINLASVFFFEYAIIVCFADRSTLGYSGDFWHKHAFVVLNFCYQFGVFFSRTSLVCFKIHKIWIVSIL